MPANGDLTRRLKG